MQSKKRSYMGGRGLPVYWKKQRWTKLVEEWKEDFNCQELGKPVLIISFPYLNWFEKDKNHLKQTCKFYFKLVEVVSYYAVLL